MAKTVSCRDVGADCDFVARGANEEELMQQVANHARVEHNMNEIPAEVRDKLHAAIRDEKAA
jgi:predicted small metal-binding protein